MTHNTFDISEAVAAYLEAQLMIQARTDDQGNEIDMLSEHYDIDDIDPHYVAHVRREIDALVREHSDLIERYLGTTVSLGSQRQQMSSGQFGHDFYLTRERDGVGFWDRGLGELGDTLTDIAQDMGDADPLYPASELDRDTRYRASALYCGTRIELSTHMCLDCERASSPWYGTQFEVTGHVAQHLREGQTIDTLMTTVDQWELDQCRDWFADGAASGERAQMPYWATEFFDLEALANMSGREIQFFLLGHREGYNRAAMIGTRFGGTIADYVAHLAGRITDDRTHLVDVDPDHFSDISEADYLEICALSLSGLCEEISAAIAGEPLR